MTESALINLLNASKCMAESPTFEACCEVFLKSISFFGVTEGWTALPGPQGSTIKIQPLFGGDAPSTAVSERITQFVTERLSQSPYAAVLAKAEWSVGAFATSVEKVLFVPVVALAPSPGAMVLGVPASCSSADVLDQLKLLADHAAVHLSNALLRARQASTIQYLREFDDLVTRLPNRIRFRRLLQEALAPAQIAAPVVVLFADLDSFNAINQRYGYTAGDHALLVVSQRWQRTLQQTAPQATLARMGGDEFACLLVAPLEIQRAEEIAQRLLDAVHEPLLMENEKCVLTASIGIARSPEHGRQVEELLRSAELAMNTAKTRGKGRWCWHTASANRTPAALQAKG